MRLHRLRLQAFGPFAGCEEIDFDDVCADGLHLIHGPTGAGKSSILDAICFALFSGVPGHRMQGRDTLHSDHAAPTVRPEVELEFTVDGRRLRVQRSPEHRVAKKRGTGTRPQRGAVSLQELRSGRWTMVSTRADEAGQLIGDLLGMGLPQFAQVMLLPQGEFTAFLRAKPDDRGKLLERLFDISGFAAVEQWIVDHRKALETEKVRADVERAALVARAREALSGIPTSDDDAEPPCVFDLGTDTTPEALQARVEHLSAQLTAAMADADRATTHADRTRARLADQRALANLQAQARHARQTLHQLDAQAATIAAAQEQLHLAERADGCRSAIAALGRREAALRSAGEATARARAELAAQSSWPLPESHGALPVTEAALQPLHDRAVAGTDALAGQAELLRQVDAAEDELRSAAREHQRASDNAARCAATVTDTAGQLAEVTTVLDRHRPRAATESRWLELLEGVDAVMKAGRSATTDLQRAVQSAEEHRSAQHAWAAAEQEVIRLRQARLTGIAAELASGLRHGDPCPVCGGVEHPHPARTEPDHVDAEQVRAAEEAAAAALSHAEHAAARWSTAAGRAESTCGLLRDTLQVSVFGVEQATPAGARLDAAAAQLRAIADRLRPRVDALAHTLAADPLGIGAVDVRLLQELRADLSTVRSTIAEGAAQASDATQQVRALEDRQNRLRDAKLRAEQAAASAVETARAAQGRVELFDIQCTTARERLDELLHEHASVCGCSGDGADDAAGHARCVGLLTGLTAAARAERVAAAEVAAARGEVEQTLRDHRFDDIGSATDAALAQAEQQRLRELVDAARTERAKATGVLELPDVAMACSGGPADVDGVTAELSIAERSARHTQEAVGDLRRSLQTLERIAADLRTHDDRTAPLHEQLAVATSLAAALTGSGDNVMRMRLTAYVLAARLESVTALANERLHAMTDGRYQLEHTDQKAGRGAKSGLGLRVRDAWTGTTRDTSTLSGGESFIASLALALGLGDAVLQAAGGRPLETLLVDEGFGSLDEESLDQVLDVLDALRAGGRSVGIVSHVAELRSRIPAQIEVTKTTSGSTLRVRHATDAA